ncbi:NUDIX hydrolase [Demequina soli]|uniref:NUDIX hydrolase n=1 Tax=Demequina soli TaxID=1638987 RepID=UPI0007827A54|nr:NUDIX domain-containing protein [Demequina soli]
MTTYRDSSGKALTDYPRPSVAVDTAVLTVAGGALSVLLVDDARDGAAAPKTRRLPGTFLHEGEVLADAVRRSLADKAGVAGLEPVQLHVFDGPDRDDRGWVLSVAHLVAVPAPLLGDAALVPIADVGPLGFDHAAILALAVARLRADYAEHPDPWGLLGEGPFTLLDLERLHRAVDPGRPGRKDTFRRLMEPQLVDTGDLEHGTVGKPARLFTRSRGD